MAGADAPSSRTREAVVLRASPMPAPCPAAAARSCTSWPRARRPRASSYVLQPLPPQIGRKRVGGDEHAHDAAIACPAPSGRQRARAIASCERARSAPAQLNSRDGARRARRRRAAAAASASARRIEARRRSAAGVATDRRARPRAPSSTSAAQSRRCAGATTGRPDGHVLEHLQRRPVEGELQRRVRGRRRTAPRRCRRPRAAAGIAS